jgi:hypothetical protein
VRERETEREGKRVKEREREGSTLCEDFNKKKK